MHSLTSFFVLQSSQNSSSGESTGSDVGDDVN